MVAAGGGEADGAFAAELMEVTRHPLIMHAEIKDKMNDIYISPLHLVVGGVWTLQAVGNWRAKV